MVIEHPAFEPNNVLLIAVVIRLPELAPTIVVYDAVVTLEPAFTPIIALDIPVEFNLPAVSPIVIVLDLVCSF